MATDLNLAVETYENLKSLEPLRPEWATLLGTYPSSTIFSTYEWLAPWWRAFGENDSLLVQGFHDSSHSLVGLVPLAITTLPGFPRQLRLMRLMGDGSHDSDNLDVPVRPGYEGEIACRLLDWAEQNASLWDVCQLNTLPSDSLVGNRLLHELRARGWKHFISTRPQTVVHLAESWESYLKGISSKERGKIGLRTRRLEKKYEVRIRRCSEEREVDPFLEALFELHGKHWQLRGLPGTLHSPARRKFYRELARLLLASRKLEFWTLELNGTIVAAQFGLRYDSTVFSLQEGFDPEYSSDSVGYVLRSQVLKQLISEGIRSYDFLGGTDESKVRWGGEVKNYLNIHFARPLSRGSFHLVLKSRSAETRNWLRSQLPAVWNILKSARRAAGKRN